MPLSPYEREALAAIGRWKAARVAAGEGPPLARGRGRARRAVAAAAAGPGTRTAAAASSALVPVVTEALTGAAHWRVDGFARRHHRAAGIVDPFAADLAQLDRAARGIRTRYVPSMAAQGACAGWLGPVGLAVDVPSLVLCTLRAVGETGAHYGFDLALPYERVYAAEVLHLAVAGSPAARAGTLGDLQQLSASIAQGVVATQLDAAMVANLAPRLARSLGLALTGRLSRLVPIAGTVASAAANAAVTAAACEAASMLYRERYLVVKHGAAAQLPAAHP